MEVCGIIRIVMKYLHLLRLSHYTKNLFIFAPLFFSGRLFEQGLLDNCVLGFFLFSLCASSIYIINDLQDAPFDRLHLSKKKRPLASGAVSRGEALFLFVLLGGGSLLGAFLMHQQFFWVLLVYFSMNLLYTFWLKKVSLIDIIVISAGFILRVAAGGILTGIVVSHWLFVMTFLLSLFLALAKRRDDLIILRDTGQQMRKSLHGYNLEFISSALSILSAVLIVSYIDYVTSAEVMARFYGKHAYVSLVFVVTGLLRYLQITLVESKSGSPTRLLLNDRFLQVTITLWMAYFAGIIYLLK
jgi:decaprenyl-phosphate phosphoribosyltransferase